MLKIFLFATLLQVLLTCYESAQSQSQVTGDEGVRQAWGRHFTKPGHGNEYVTAMAVDRTGNVYVAGCSEIAPYQCDYVANKYDAAGVQQWSVRYNGPSNGNDQAMAIAVDRDGNVYVTGVSARHALSVDFVTLKYSSDGSELWQARYANAGDEYIPGMQLLLDPFGNFYVSGASGRDYLIIKYDGEGNQLWEARYDGPEREYDFPRAMALDAHGNVYVTGNSQNYTDIDIATVAYSTLGSKLWASRYTGIEGRDAVAAAICLDDSGNVYVAGTRYAGNTRNDYVTLKYDSTGRNLWEAIYNGEDDHDDVAVALALDKYSRAWITGSSRDKNSKVNIATIVYSAVGGEQRIAAFHNSSSNSISPVSLVIDELRENILVAGVNTDKRPEFIVLKYDEMGGEQMIMQQRFPGRFDGHAVAFLVDALENICFATTIWDSTTFYDMITLKRNHDDTLQWQRRHNNNAGGQLEQLAASAMALDSSEHVYVAGTGYLVSYDQAGNTAWHSANGIRASSVQIDRGANIYVTGSVLIEHEYEGVLAKFDASGSELWRKYFIKPEAASISPTAMVLSTTGNIYIAGSRALNGSEAYAIIKYDIHGAQEWMVFYEGPSGFARPAALALDADDNVYVTGASVGANTGIDYATIKYNKTGTLEWIARFDGPSHQNDSARDLVLDTQGNVFVTGSSVGLESGSDYLTIKYDFKGKKKWTARYKGTWKKSSDAAYAMAFDSFGNLYVTGASAYACATIMYDSLGQIVWSDLFASDDKNPGVTLTTDFHGNVYIAGAAYSRDPLDDSDLFVLKYNASGKRLWSTIYDGPRSSDDYPVAIKAASSGSIYVAGNASWNGEPTGSVYTVLKYVQDNVAGVKSKESSREVLGYLSPNHPNPFNPSTTIRYALARAGRVSLKIYNLAGQEVATLVDDDKTAGEHEIKWTPANLASGVYLYRLHAGDFVETKKLVLLQ